MAFGKRFPKDVPGSNFPQWVEISLTHKDEREIEEKARQNNIRLMKICLADAKDIMQDQGLKSYDTVQSNIARALFEKLASHAVWWKEAECKDRFDKQK